MNMLMYWVILLFVAVILGFLMPNVVLSSLVGGLWGLGFTYYCQHKDWI